MGNIGSIPGSYIWPKTYGPFYVKSFGAEIAILGFAVCLAFVLRTYLKRENRKLDREEGTEDDGVAEGEKGFRYLY
jgi:hypothetical protein